MKSLKGRFSLSKKHLIYFFSILLLLLSFPTRFFLISHQKERPFDTADKFINKSQQDNNNLKSLKTNDNNLEKTTQYKYFYQKGILSYQSGNFTNAANSLEKALEAKNIPEVRSLLSQIYNLLGMKEIETKNYDKSIVFFKKSFNISDNFQSLLGLSNAFILKGDIDKALSTLIKASELYPKKADIYFNLGQIYHQKGDEEKAVDYWKKTLELDPGDIKSETALRRVRTELGIDENILEKKDSSFIFESGGTPNSFSRAIILTMLQQSHEKIEKNLNMLPSAKIKIFLDFNTMFNPMDPGPNKNIIVDNGKMKIPVLDFKKSSDQMKKAIMYSYTKFIISDYTERRCPAWLAEGLSLYESDENNTFYPILIRDMLGSGKFIKLDDLVLSFQNLNKKNIPIAYALSSAAVEMIITKYGISALRDLLTKLKRGESFENGISFALKLNYNDFQKIFESYLKEKYKI